MQQFEMHWLKMESLSDDCCILKLLQFLCNSYATLFKFLFFQNLISDMKFKYKEERSLAPRRADGDKVRIRYPDRVPGRLLLL